MELWKSIKFAIEESIPTNDGMFWNTDFWWLLWIPAWPFFISLVVTVDFDAWQQVLGGVTALIVLLWGRLILRLRQQKKQNWTEASRFSDHTGEGGY